MERNIRDLVFGLRKAIDEIDTQLKEIEKSDAFKENTELLQKNNKLLASLKKNEAERALLSSDNSALKNALYEQYFNEKISLADKAQHKMDVFFAAETQGEINRLAALEKAIKWRLQQLQQYSNQFHAEISSAAEEKIQNLQNEIIGDINKARENAQNTSITEAEKTEYARLRQENVTGEQITALSSKNNFEKYIGLNILNTIGIILFIIGAIAAGQFGYIWVSFAMGTGFLAAGEIMNRRRANIFSLGITAGGVGILYTSLAVGHFFHQTISMYPALIICVAITAIAFYLSTRYNAQTLLGITLVGGYLPILSVLLDGGVSLRPLVFGMMVYFVLFNLLALALAFRNKWIVATFVGLCLNIIGTIFITAEIGRFDPLFDRAIGLVYIGFAMLIYNVIPIVATYITKAKFRISDVVLVSINTFFGSLIMLANISSYGWDDYLGFALALYAVIYFAAGYFIARKFESSRAMANLMQIAAIIFAFAFVPMQVAGMWNAAEWLVPAWMLLAAVLAIYAVYRGHLLFYIGSLAVGCAGLMWFLFVNMADVMWSASFIDEFTLQYGSVTAAGLAVLVMLTLRNKIPAMAQRVFKYCNAINLWIFGLYMISRLWDSLLINFPYSLISVDYLMLSFMAVFTLAYGKVCVKIPRLADGGMHIISMCLGGLALAWIIVLNLLEGPTTGTFAMTDHPTNIIVIATLILVSIEGIGIYVVYDLVRRAVVKKLIGIQYLPLVVSTYFVLVFTANLTTNYNLDFASFWISATYIVTALLWTLLGFIRRYALLRRFGLVLALFSVAKLFIFDLQFLTQERRIFSYFVMGAVLVIISFVYQYFSKRLEFGLKLEKAAAEEHSDKQ